MKTYTVKIENGAGTIQTINPCHGISDKEWNSIGKYIPADQIEGQERYEVDRGEPKGSTVPPTYAWRIKDGLYEMEKGESYHARNESSFTMDGEAPDEIVEWKSDPIWRVVKKL